MLRSRYTPSNTTKVLLYLLCDNGSPLTTLVIIEKVIEDDDENDEFNDAVVDIVRILEAGDVVGDGDFGGGNDDDECCCNSNDDKDDALRRLLRLFFFDDVDKNGV